MKFPGVHNFLKVKENAKGTTKTFFDGIDKMNKVNDLRTKFLVEISERRASEISIFEIYKEYVKVSDYEILKINNEKKSIYYMDDKEELVFAMCSWKGDSREEVTKLGQGVDNAIRNRLTLDCVRWVNPLMDGKDVPRIKEVLEDVFKISTKIYNIDGFCDMLENDAESIRDELARLI